MNFLTTNRSNPCPCCNDISAKCRNKSTSFSLPDHSVIEDQLFLCMAFREDTNTHKFTGETSDRLWGKFISHELSNTLSQAWAKGNTPNTTRTGKLTTIKRPPSTKKREFSHLLSIAERHEQITLLLAQLSLTEYHRQGLIQRGFSDEQINLYGFKSVSYQQTLVSPISARLAGVALGGRNLTNNFSGLIVPIRNFEGFYLGWQYRLNYASNCRYLWASSEGLSSHLQEYSELPLSFNFPHAGVINHDYIALTEGVGFKPQLTANRFQLISLGASGGLFAASPQLLKLYLTKASNILRTKSVLLFPDAGAVHNPLVLRNYKRTIDLISNFGFSVAIAWWGQVNQSQPDPDRFQGDYQVISTLAFFNLGLKYSAFFPDENNRNVVRQFLDILSHSHNSAELKQAVEIFQSRYFQQFDLIKRICWQHLDPQRKQLISALYD